jgi:antitoxin PrlF
MDVRATITSKGQITLPKIVRDHLGLAPGDRVVFRLEGERAVLAKTPDLLKSAGTVHVPSAKRATPWDQVRRASRRARAASGS